MLTQELAVCYFRPWTKVFWLAIAEAMASGSLVITTISTDERRVGGTAAFIDKRPVETLQLKNGKHLVRPQF
jgi:hypothetical protein